MLGTLPVTLTIVHMCSFTCEAHYMRSEIIHISYGNVWTLKIEQFCGLDCVFLLFSYNLCILLCEHWYMDLQKEPNYSYLYLYVVLRESLEDFVPAC